MRKPRDGQPRPPRPPSAMGIAADMLTAQLTRAENVLRNFTPAVTARLPLEGFEGVEPDEQLLFTKYEDRWGLYVRAGANSPRVQPYALTPLKLAPLAHR